MDHKTETVRTFVIWNERNDYNEYIAFIKQNKKDKSRHISFNGLDFDSQITEFLLRGEKELSKLNANELSEEIYKVAQDTIERKRNEEFLEYSPNQLSIKHIDVFKLNHWDNAAKRSSLKWIQGSLRWHNLQEMPHEHFVKVSSEQELQVVVDYCINDIKATKKIFEVSYSQIELRKKLSKEYELDLLSASEARMAKELFLLALSDKLQISKYEIKPLRTIRESIIAKDIILKSIRFKTPLFNKLLDKFRGLTITPLEKQKIKYSVTYKGMKIDYGLGGIHGATKTGVYTAQDGMIIMTSDVKSFYPNLAIANEWAPAHLPNKHFSELYKWYYNERVKIPKKDPKNYVYKILLNCVYGLSKEANSFLYDPLLTMSITINGQLLLTMFLEMIVESIPGTIPLMINTDGLEVIIPEKYKDTYLELAKSWEELTRLELEHDEYTKIVLGDVNNYIAVFKPVELIFEDWYEKQKKDKVGHYYQEHGKFYYSVIKCKGRFEFEDRPLHKDPSKLIVPKALYNFFIKGVKPEEYIKSNRDILDYCIVKKVNSEWGIKAVYVKDGVVMHEKQQSVIRYYISQKGVKLIKFNELDGREERLEAESLSRVFNVYEECEWSDYGVDIRYYVNAVYNEIDKLVPYYKQTSLTLF
jgi:hypothetical protein